MVLSVGYTHGLKTVREITINSKNKTEYIVECSCGVILKQDKHRFFFTLKCQSCSSRGVKGASAWHALFVSYRNSARRRLLEFTISENELKSICSRPCVYCGIVPLQVYGRAKFFGSVLYNGIDRANNTQGYTISNCYACCKICNFAKGNMSEADWFIWISRIVMYTNDNNKGV